MRYDSLTDLGFSAGEPAGNRNGMEGSDPDNAIVLGIDPGLSGAICLMNHDGVLLVEDLPTHTAQHGSRAKTRAELDLHTHCGSGLSVTNYVTSR